MDRASPEWHKFFTEDDKARIQEAHRVMDRWKDGPYSALAMEIYRDSKLISIMANLLTLAEQEFGDTDPKGKENAEKQLFQ